MVNHLRWLDVVSLKNGGIMERVDLPLSQLTLAQKLELMETLWRDLSRNEEALESPDWHEAVLKDREAALASGKTSVSDWEESKEKVRKKLS